VSPRIVINQSFEASEPDVKLFRFKDKLHVKRAQNDFMQFKLRRIEHDRANEESSQRSAKCFEYQDAYDIKSQEFQISIPESVFKTHDPKISLEVEHVWTFS
jgi:hypothetical protein